MNQTTPPTSDAIASLLRAIAERVGGTFSPGHTKHRSRENWENWEWIGPCGVTADGCTKHPHLSDGDAFWLAWKLGITIRPASSAEEMRMSICNEAAREIAAQAGEGEPTIADKGPWRVCEDGKTVCSEDFTVDARLVIDGDFIDNYHRKDYADWLAKKLNATSPPHVADALDGVPTLRFDGDSVEAVVQHLLTAGYSCDGDHEDFFMGVKNAMESAIAARAEAGESK